MFLYAPHFGKQNINNSTGEYSSVVKSSIVKKKKKEKFLTPQGK